MDDTKSKPPRGMARMSFDASAAANYLERERQKKLQREQAKFDKLKVKPILNAMTAIDVKEYKK
jgi:hypothetical protein